MTRRLISALLSLGLLVAAVAASAQNVAPAPPMGWNSWDAYGFTIDEAEFKANVAELAKLRAYGWSYAVSMKAGTWAIRSATTCAIAITPWMRTVC
jgi:hypothetical protein